MPLRVDRQFVEILCSLASSTEHNESATVAVDVTPAATLNHAAVIGATGTLAVTAACSVTTVLGLAVSTVVDISAFAEGHIRLYEAASGCGIDVAASVLSVYNGSATVPFEITPAAYIERVISRTATTAIIVETQVAVQGVFNREIEVEVQTITPTLDTTTYLLTDIISGLDCDVIVNQDHLLGTVQPIGIRATAARTLVRADAIDLAASTEVAVGVGLVKNETGSSQVAIPIQVSVVVDKCLVGSAEIDPQCIASAAIVRTLVAECGIIVESRLGYAVSESGVEFQYRPFIGAGGAADPDPPAATLADPLDGEDGCQFIYPAVGEATDTLSLRPPQLGNRDRLSFTRILTETRGGTVIAYADVSWPKTHTLVMTFSALTPVEKDNVLAFFSNHFGQEIGFMDWERRYWRGIVMTPGEQAVQDRDDSYTINVEFEGEVA